MEPIDWEVIYVQLYAYADQLLKAYSWFRKDKTDSYLKGKQAHDYVAEAIEKYLRSPEKYDPSSGRSLVTYLKWHIIRSSVGNDVRSPENKTSSTLLSDADQDDDNDLFSNIEAFLPFVKASFDENVDYKKILKEIENELQDDEMTKLIFEEIRCNGMDRRDVIKKYELSSNDFDNGMKRMKTVLRKIAKQYSYE
jgi:DNA-directed RNA polymerase specialized sigma24 family protein